MTTSEGASKLFSMIDGRAVSIAPGAKRLPADAFSTLLSCTELLEATKKDAEEYRKQVTAECEEIKAHAEAEGFQAGFDQWTQTVSYLEGEIAKVHEELQKVVMPA